MDSERQRRVWAAAGYAGLTKPGLAKAFGTSVDTLKRRVRGTQSWGAFESEDEFLRRVAAKCGLPYEFFLIDFTALPELYERSQSLSEPTAEELEQANALLQEAVSLATKRLREAHDGGSLPQVQEGSDSPPAAAGGTRPPAR